MIEVFPMLTIALFLILEQAPAPAPVAPPASAARVVAAPQTELLQIKYVYLLPMASGMDQFLADRLTRGGMVQVVTDPAKADAVFTERLGAGFEQRMEELYPTPKPEVAPKKPKDDKDEEDKDSKPSAFDFKAASADRVSSMGRGKGTVFLVHRGSRNVVWSVYDKPRTQQPKELERTAKRIADRLADAMQKQGRSKGN